MDGDVSLGAADEPSVSLALGGDPLDPAAFTDFEDEATLINDLLASEAAKADANGIGEDTNIGTTLDAVASSLSLLELDGKLARILGILEHACQDTSAQVERAIEEVARAVPRLTFDLQLMRENVVLLRFTLDSIRKRSAEAAVQSETSQVMRRLKVLDTIKTRMEAARDVLREAEAWSSLDSEVTALVQEQSYAKAAERLAEANKSMVVFQNSPEYEQRRSLMVSLQNGLEAGLSASLVTAINSRDMTACKNYYAIFGQIQRETEFQNYYFGSRRAHLLSDWQYAKLTDCSTSTAPDAVAPTSASRATSPIPPSPFSHYVVSFYSRLQACLNEERTYIPAIFPEPLETLSAFLQSTVDSLIPSFPQRISDLSNTHGPALLTELIKLYQSTEEFALAVDRIFSRMSASLEPPSASPLSITPSPSTPQHGPLPSPSTGTPSTRTASSDTIKRMRRQSKAMSISRRHSRGGLSMFGAVSGHLGGQASSHGRLSIAEADEPIRAWETSLFEPFLDRQAEYADLEARLLHSEISRISAGQHPITYLFNDASASASGVDSDDDGLSSQSANIAKHLLDQSLSVIGLAENALGRCMALTHGYGAAGYIEAVDDAFKTFLVKERDTLVRAIDSRSSRRRAGTSQRQAEHGLEYSQEDWAMFQLALRLLDSCRSIWKRLDELETKVRSRLVDVASLIKDARSDPLGQVVPGTTKGALLLLWQSNLNSAALNTLLDSVEQRQQSGPDGRRAALFAGAHRATIDLTKASQAFLHDTVLAPLLQALDKYASLPVWSQGSQAQPDARGAAFDLHIPSFSLSPSEVITRVGEGLFNLPGLFETYAEDDALGFSLDTLPGLDSVHVKHLRQEHGYSSSVGLESHTVAYSNPSSANIARHAHRMSVVGNEFLTTKADPTASAQKPRISPSLSHHSSYSLSHPPGVTSPADEPVSAEVVISTWLSSLARAVLGHLVKKTLPSLRFLSKHGSAQLASDLSYISNVAKALDVELEELESWKRALEGGSGDDIDGSASSSPIDVEILDTVKRLQSGHVAHRA